jgi:hypothetical protein
MQKKEESEEEPEPNLSSEDMESNDNSQNKPQTTQLATLDSAHSKHIEIHLKELRNGQWPVEPSKTQDNASDAALNALNYKDFPALCCAQAKLNIASKDTELDLTFQSHIAAMVGTLNLYLDPKLSYTWCESFLVVAKSLGLGVCKGNLTTLRRILHLDLAKGNPK